MVRPFDFRAGIGRLALAAAFCLAAVPALGLPGTTGFKAASAGSPLVLAQRRNDPSAPVIQAPRGKRGGSLFNIAPFASPTAPVPRRAPSGDVPSSPAGSSSSPSDLAPDDGKEFAVPEAPVVPPYEKEILRLAELLGSLHYLRALCGTNEGSLWRDEMEKLVEAEPANDIWRSRLTQSFNSGYSAFDRTYRACTPSAARAAGLFIDEGKTLIATIRTRYAY